MFGLELSLSELVLGGVGLGLELCELGLLCALELSLSVSSPAMAVRAKF